MNKRGQQSVGMSFGMIFAIFLIVVFVVIAGIAIHSFLDIGESAEVGMFYDDLQSAVDSAIRSQSTEKNFDIELPSGVEKICFGNLSAEITNMGSDYEAIRDYEVYEANTFLVPPEYAQDMAWKYIDRINISKITKNKNPYCVDVNNDLKIVKGFYDKLVCIGEDCDVRDGYASSEEDISETERICNKAQDEDACSLLSFAKGEDYLKKCCDDYERCC